MPVVQRQVGHIRPYGAYGRRVTRHPGSPPTRALLSKKKKPEHQRFHQGRAGGAQMFMSCVLLSSPTTRRYNNVLISIRLPYQDRLTVCVLRESSFDLSFSGAATVPSSCWAGPGRSWRGFCWLEPHNTSVVGVGVRPLMNTSSVDGRSERAKYQQRTVHVESHQRFVRHARQCMHACNERLKRGHFFLLFCRKKRRNQNEKATLLWSMDKDESLLMFQHKTLLSLVDWLLKNERAQILLYWSGTR